MMASKPSLLGAKGYPQQRCDDTSAGDKCATQRARNFGFATGTVAVIHRDFEDAQPSASGFHLHLQIPAVSFLAHLKLGERVTPDGTERTHVSVTNAVEQLHYPSRNSPG